MSDFFLEPVHHCRQMSDLTSLSDPGLRGEAKSKTSIANESTWRAVAAACEYVGRASSKKELHDRLDEMSIVVDVIGMPFSRVRQIYIAFPGDARWRKSGGLRSMYEEMCASEDAVRRKSWLIRQEQKTRVRPSEGQVTERRRNSAMFPRREYHLDPDNLPTPGEIKTLSDSEKTSLCIDLVRLCQSLQRELQGVCV